MNTDISNTLTSEEVLRLKCVKMASKNNPLGNTEMVRIANEIYQFIKTGASNGKHAAGLYQTSGDPKEAFLKPQGEGTWLTSE